MNQYEPVIKVYVRGYTFIEEKPIDQALVNKFCSDQKYQHRLTDVTEHLEMIFNVIFYKS